eukprot:TRINITY_DN17476_c2_g1_i1.p4 TRINITY_DN17476_c2_g1~~TRINITY_DN17476_c2_g1_i1.p4  ORF type:complete len:106 (+),score=2.41 TRINITY_DN17476_c2_g1_i1:182-499(+)
MCVNWPCIGFMESIYNFIACLDCNIRRIIIQYYTVDRYNGSICGQQIQLEEILFLLDQNQDLKFFGWNCLLNFGEGFFWEVQEVQQHLQQPFVLTIFYNNILYCV